MGLIISLMKSFEVDTFILRNFLLIIVLYQTVSGSEVIYTFSLLYQFCSNSNQKLEVIRVLFA